MSALEIIEQIKALPPEEREAVVAFVENLKSPAHHAADMPSTDEKFEKAADHVFQNYGGLLERLAK